MKVKEPTTKQDKYLQTMNLNELARFSLMLRRDGALAAIEWAKPFIEQKD